MKYVIVAPAMVLFASPGLAAEASSLAYSPTVIAEIANEPLAKGFFAHGLIAVSMPSIERPKVQALEAETALLRPADDVHRARLQRVLWVLWPLRASVQALRWVVAFLKTQAPTAGLAVALEKALNAIPDLPTDAMQTELCRVTQDIEGAVENLDETTLDAKGKADFLALIKSIKSAVCLAPERRALKTRWSAKEAGKIQGDGFGRKIGVN